MPIQERHHKHRQSGTPDSGQPTFVNKNPPGPSKWLHGNLGSVFCVFFESPWTRQHMTFQDVPRKLSDLVDRAVIFNKAASIV